MTKARLMCVPLLSALAATALTTSARADEYVIILLDQTGSMCADMATCPKVIDGTDPNWTQLPPWINAIDDAKLWVNDDSANGAATTQRYYAIWTFKNTQDSAQTTAKLLWPTATFKDNCPDAQIVAINAESSFCKLTKQAVSYAKLQAVLETIKDKPGEIPQPTWLTPLADSLCRGLSEIWPSGTSQYRTIILESDGGENYSDQVAKKCFGPAATNTNINSWQNLMSNKSTSDWGWTPVGAWQANVLRRATRLGIVGSIDPPFDAAEAAAVAAGPLAGSDNMSPYLAMKVAVDYSLCSPTDTDPVCVLNSATSPLTATPLALATRTAGALQIDGQTGTVTALAAAPRAVVSSTTSATTTTVTRTPTIKAPELGFFRALGGSTTRSKLREVVRDQSVVYGVNHKLAGDVDDSNCVDNADYSIVTQKDVWMQRAVQPLQIAIRADLNRDGWVNELDRAIVLANWGKGCINKPGPAPKP